MTTTTRAADDRRPLPDLDGTTPVGGVVVGYDGSPVALRALTWAAVEARVLGAPLTVLAAVDIEGSVGSLLARLPLRDLDRRATAHVQELAAQGAAVARDSTDTPVHAAWRLADPVQALVEASHTSALLVVGNRGRGTLRSSLLGSVAYGVAALATSPVLVLRDGNGRSPGPGAPVVVGSDGSPASTRAVDVAADLAARTGAQLRLVTAWTDLPLGVHGAVAGSLAPELHALAVAVSEAATTRARHRQPDLEVEAQVVQAEATGTLRHASRGAGRVVVGSRGHGRVLSVALGSVSQSAVQTCHCPVEVVRADPADERDDDPAAR